MFQVSLFSKPVNEVLEILNLAAAGATQHYEVSGITEIKPELISIEHVQLERGVQSPYQIMIRHIPGLPADKTQFLFIGDEFKREDLLGAYQIYAFRLPSLIDRRQPNQLMGAVMGHYFHVAESAKGGKIFCVDREGCIEVYIDGAGILPDMLDIKATLELEA